MTVVLDGADAVRAAVGTSLGSSPWIEITAERLRRFRQSVGPEPGYLALSLSNLFLPQIVEVRGFSSGVNYGTGRITFGPPLVAGDRVRGSAHLIEASDVKGALQTLMRIVIDVDGRTDPACIVESLSRWLP